jgi:type II secretory pathway component PulF
MNFIRNESGQAAGIIMAIVAVFAIGFFYILLSGIIQPYVDQFNIMIGIPGMHTSQNFWDSMDTLFHYWWSLPVFALIVIAIYAYKNAISEQTQEAY